MPKSKKIIRRIFFTLLILLPVLALAHYVIFPQETRSILVGYSNFKKDGRIYFNATTPQNKIDSLKSLIVSAAIRVGNFWGQKISDPKFIYCEKEEDFKKYCANAAAPAVTYFKLGCTIVLSSDAANIDIIAHEISHAELYERIGFYKFNYKIPSWFKHGLAMQNDYRDYYSEDTLRARTNNLKNLADIKTIKSDAVFYSGSIEEVMLNYMAAKHEVKNWYSIEKLHQFIIAINNGKSFDEAYGQ